MLKARFQPANPNEIEMTMTITMPLREWRKIHGLVGYSDSWVMADAVSKLVKAADTHWSEMASDDQ